MCLSCRILLIKYIPCCLIPRWTSSHFLVRFAGNVFLSFLCFECQLLFRVERVWVGVFPSLVQSVPWFPKVEKGRSPCNCLWYLDMRMNLVSVCGYEYIKSKNQELIRPSLTVFANVAMYVFWRAGLSCLIRFFLKYIRKFNYICMHAWRLELHVLCAYHDEGFEMICKAIVDLPWRRLHTFGYNWH